MEAQCEERYSGTWRMVPSLVLLRHKIQGEGWLEMQQERYNPVEPDQEGLIWPSEGLCTCTWRPWKGFKHKSNKVKYVISKISHWGRSMVAGGPSRPGKITVSGVSRRKLSTKIEHWWAYQLSFSYLFFHGLSCKHSLDTYNALGTQGHTHIHISDTSVPPMVHSLLRKMSVIRQCDKEGHATHIEYLAHCKCYC